MMLLFYIILIPVIMYYFAMVCLSMLNLAFHGGWVAFAVFMVFLLMAMFPLEVFCLLISAGFALIVLR